jgi:hypothetical protein
MTAAGPARSDGGGKDKGIYPERTWLMAIETAIEVPRLISIDGLGDLFGALAAGGYRVIGPAVQDGAIVLRELFSAAELPSGWGVRLEPGGYQLRRRGDAAALGGLGCGCASPTAPAAWAVSGSPMASPTTAKIHDMAKPNARTSTVVPSVTSSLTTSRPRSRAMPASGRNGVVSTRMAVGLPAP